MQKKTLQAALLLLSLLLLFPLKSSYAEEKQKLYIMNSWEEMNDTAIELFHARCPDVELVFFAEDDYRVENTRILSHDPDIDVLFLAESQGASALQAAMSGALCDLNAFDVLCAYREDFLPGLERYTYGEIWYGLPGFVQLETWEANSARFAEIGIELPGTNWSWEDFAEMAKQVRLYNEKNGTDYCLLRHDSSFIYPLSQYLNNRVDYAEGMHTLDAGELSARAQMILEWLKEGTVQDFQTGFSGTPLILARDANAYGNALLSGTQNALIVPPHGVEEQPALQVGFVFSIYADSNRKEEAAEYLACVLESYRKEGLYNTGPLFRQDARISLDAADGLTQKNTETWIYMLENSVFDPLFLPLNRAICIDGWNDVRSGVKSVEDYADWCVRQADWMLGE